MSGLEGNKKGMTLKQRYVHHRNLLAKGYSEFAMLIGLWNSAALLMMVLSYLGLPPQYAWLTFLVIPVVATALYLYGRFYYKHRLFEEENEWTKRVNPAFHEMMEEIRKQKGDSCGHTRKTD